MTRVLVVCTGNVCRSPIAEGLLRAAFVERLGDGAPEVTSAGTMGWEGSGADPNSITAAAERGVDISGHVARGLASADLGSADLVLAMGSEHAVAAGEDAPEAASRTFTLKELVRLVEALPEPVAGEDLRTRIEAADALRAEGFEGNPRDLDVADPLGMPLESFRAVTWELEEWCGRLADGLVGRAPARAGFAEGG
jgi:protein-tyrosine phosphatase